MEETHRLQKWTHEIDSCRIIPYSHNYVAMTGCSFFKSRRKNLGLNWALYIPTEVGNSASMASPAILLPLPVDSTPEIFLSGGKKKGDERRRRKWVGVGVVADSFTYLLVTTWQPPFFFLPYQAADQWCWIWQLQYKSLSSHLRAVIVVLYKLVLHCNTNWPKGIFDGYCYKRYWGFWLF